jgi:autotransporter translocation and assembly factor TamB
LDAASGYRVAFSGLELHAGSARLSGLTVSRGSEPLLAARSVALRFDLHDLLPGARQRGAIRDVVLSEPTLSIVRHADGSFNAGGFASPGGNAPGGGAAAPLRFTLRVDDGRIVLSDAFRKLPGSRRIEIDALGIHGRIDSGAESRLNARGRLSSAGLPGAAIPLSLDARSDASRGFSLLRLRAARVPLRDLLNYLINSKSAEVLAGEARDLDLRAYALDLNAARPQGYHFTGSLNLAGASLDIPGLRLPLRELTGRVDLFDGGLAAPDASGRLGGVAVRLSGGLYDWSAPAFRLGLRADAPLEQVRLLFNFSRRLPIAGRVAVRGLVEGPVGTPLVATRVAAPSVRYATIQLHDVDGDAVYYDSGLLLAPVRAGYGPLSGSVRGALDLGEAAISRLVVDADAPPASVPYLAQTVPGAPLRATGVLLGSDLALEARGVFDGRGGGDEIAGTFHVDRFGDGIIGPFRASRADGASLAGAYFANRVASESGFWLDARDFTFDRIEPAPSLPGLAGLAPPQFAARLNARLAGDGTPANFAVAGAVSGEGLALGIVRVDRFSGQVAGSPADIRLAGLNAEGPWGHFRGDGGYTGGALALRGDYRGSFERLEAFTGNLGARGALAAPVTLLVSADRTLVQTSGAASPTGSVHGVPVDALSGTLAVAGKDIRIYAASAQVAGGAMVATGGLGTGESVAVSVAGADARRLKATGLPVRSGGIDALGSVRESAGEPRFEGVVALVGGRVGPAPGRGGRAAGAGASAAGRVARLGLSVNASVEADPQRVDFHGVGILAGPAYATGSGSLTGFAGGAPAYRVALQARDVPVQPFARIVYPKRHDIAGTLNLGVVAQGRGGGVTRVSGNVGVPEGAVNGQAFRDGRLALDTGQGSVSIRDGSMVVGSTALAFSADIRGQDAALRFSAPRADLSDFDDLFDTGDTLDGRGNVAGSFTRTAGTVHTAGGADVAGLRYRRFDLGDAAAKWSSTGQKVDARLSFGGASGQLQAAGTFTLPARAPLDKFLQRTRFAGTAKVQALDLGTWLPVLGYQLPITGRVDATATVSGPVNAPLVRADAVLSGGVLGKFPVQRAHVSFDAGLTGADVRSAEFQLSSLDLTGSGRIGFGENDPLQFSAHGTSADIGDLTSRFFKTKLSLTGTGEVDIKVAGRRAKPSVAGGFDIEKASLNGVQFPRVLGQFQLEGRDVVVSGAEVNFAKGSLQLAGSVPFTFSPFAFGPAESPIALDVTADAIDLADFASLLEHNATVAGRLDGRIAIGGTAGDPALNGDLALTGGAYSTTAESVPLTKLGAKLSFSGNGVRLDALHGEAGGGTFDGEGSATLPDLVHPGADASYALRGTAKALRLDLPALGRGQIDGTVALTHQPGSAPLLALDATLKDAIIPFSALLLAGGTSGGPSLDIPSETAPVRPSLALALKVTAGSNVRVRSGNVDVGGRGSLDVAGTLAAPQLTGQFVSTGGTLAYVNRVFRVQSGTVTFTPDQGVIPSLVAVATAHVPNSDPNPARNPSGTADVRIDVSGPVTNLNIQLTSDPAYDRQQILGLLLGAPAIGANSLFDSQTPGQQLTAAGSLAGSSTVNRNGEFSVGQEAFGVVNAQFTRTLLAPFENAFGDALGLSSFALNIDYGGGVGLSARKILGKNVNFIYATSFAYPYRQTFGFDIKPNPSSAIQVTVFQTIGVYSFGTSSYGGYLFNPLQPVNQRATAAQPSTGTVGFSLSLQRLFR